MPPLKGEVNTNCTGFLALSQHQLILAENVLVNKITLCGPSHVYDSIVFPIWSFSRLVMPFYEYLVLGLPLLLFPLSESFTHIILFHIPLSPHVHNRLSVVPLCRCPIWFHVLEHPYISYPLHPWMTLSSTTYQIHLFSFSWLFSSSTSVVIEDLHYVPQWRKAVSENKTS